MGLLDKGFPTSRGELLHPAPLRVSMKKRATCISNPYGPTASNLGFFDDIPTHLSKQGSFAYVSRRVCT